MTRTSKPERTARVDALAVLPIFLKLRGKRAVLAGGSEPALWKAELLAAAGSDVHVFSPAFDADFTALSASPPDGSITLHHRDWVAGDLIGAAVAIGAMIEDGDAATFAAAARAKGVPVNVIDRPDFCDFQFGAIVNRSPLVVAISTDGAAPVFGQMIRSTIEAMLPQGFKRWAEAAKAWRREGDRLGADMPAKRRFWQRFTDLAVANASRAPTADDLNALLADIERDGNAIAGGHVTIAGAGPGDVELLTLKAVRALRSADVVIYDDLVAPEVLEFARREARRIHVGRAEHGPACQQTEVNRLIEEWSAAGKRVVRLTPGDPTIFGRGATDIAALRAAATSFDVIPGITAAQGAAASLKFSLTQRDVAKRLQFITGHSRDGRLPEHLDWSALADRLATTTVYMMADALGDLSARLIAEGLPPDTPAAAVFAATRPEQRMIAGSIAEIAEIVSHAGISGPCLILIGSVVHGAIEPNSSSLHVFGMVTGDVPSVRGETQIAEPAQLCPKGNTPAK